MDRDTVKACFDLIGKISEVLGGLTHREALPAARGLQELHDVIGEELPGGHFGQCEGCEKLLGNDDTFHSSDDCYLCDECCDHAGSEPAGAVPE